MSQHQAHQQQPQQQQPPQPQSQQQQQQQQQLQQQAASSSMSTPSTSNVDGCKSVSASNSSSSGRFHSQILSHLTSNATGNAKKTSVTSSRPPVLGLEGSSSSTATTTTTVAATAVAVGSNVGAVNATAGTSSMTTPKLPQPSAMAVPMKLFAAWEIEKTPANCIPRLCSLTINKLQLSRKFATEIGSLAIAAKIMSSKRTLRSNEINLAYYLANQPSSSHNLSQVKSASLRQQSPVTGNTHSSTQQPIDMGISSSFSPDCATQGRDVSSAGNVDDDDWISIDLHLTFALQYPHFLKKDGNELQLLLQRRKRYKNRAILGFKTYAIGCLNLNEVLQRSNHINRQLDLTGCTKSCKRPSIVASIIMTSVKSSPIDTPEVSSGTNRARNICNTSNMIGIVSNVNRPVTSSSFGLKRETVKTLNETSNILQLNDSAELDSDDEIILEDYSISDASDSEIMIGTVAGALLSSPHSRDRKESLDQIHNSIEDESTASPSKSMRKGHLASSSRVLSKPKWRRSFNRTKKHTSNLFNTRHTSSQRNLKQKFMSLLKKFKITDSETSDSDDEEAGKERASAKTGVKKKSIKSATLDENALANMDDIEFEFEDSDIDSISDFGDISLTSTPRPGLKPFFSSKTTLAQDCNSVILQP